MSPNPASAPASSKSARDDDQEAKREFSIWKEGTCEFRCAVCSSTFSSTPKFNKHLHLRHKMGPLKYDQMHGLESSRVRTGYLDCVLCGKRVVCEYGRMRLHFRDCHDNLELADYFFLHVYKKTPPDAVQGGASQQVLKEERPPSAKRDRIGGREAEDDGGRSLEVARQRLQPELENLWQVESGRAAAAAAGRQCGDARPTAARPTADEVQKVGQEEHGGVAEISVGQVCAGAEEEVIRAAGEQCPQGHGHLRDGHQARPPAQDQTIRLVPQNRLLQSPQAQRNSLQQQQQQQQPTIRQRQARPRQRQGRNRRKQHQILRQVLRADPVRLSRRVGKSSTPGRPRKRLAPLLPLPPELRHLGRQTGASAGAPSAAGATGRPSAGPTSTTTTRHVGGHAADRHEMTLDIEPDAESLVGGIVSLEDELDVGALVDQLSPDFGLPDEPLLEPWSDCEPARESRQIANLCSFRCHFCFQVIRTSRELIHHLRKDHGSQASIYGRDDHLEKFLVGKVTYRCPMESCDEDILCDERKIMIHAYRRHRLSLPKFMEAVGQPVTRPPRGRGPFDGEFCDAVENRCQFSCNYCDYLGSYGGVKGHLKTRHGTGCGAADQTVVRKVLYRCPLCQAVVPCDRFTISAHTTQEHAVGIAEFEKWVAVGVGRPGGDPEGGQVAPLSGQESHPKLNSADTVVTSVDEVTRSAQGRQPRPSTLGIRIDDMGGGMRFVRRLHNWTWDSP